MIFIAYSAVLVTVFMTLVLRDRVLVFKYFETIVR